MSMPAPPAPDPSQPPTPAAPADPTAQAPTPAAPTPQAPATAPAAPQWTPPPAVPTPPPAAPQQPADDGTRDISRLPQWAQKEINDLRKENADRRVTARTAVVSQHAFAAAPTLGVNGHALLSSIPFQQAAAELDPTAPDFTSKLTAKVQEILAANPWMSVQPTPATPAPPPAPAVSGGEFTGAPGEGQPITEAQLANMTPDQIAKAYADGKLKHLM